MTNIKILEEFEVTCCYRCGVSFALTKEFMDTLRRSGANFYCPSNMGHSMHFPQDTLTPPKPKTIVVEKEVIKTEKVVDHGHRFGRGKKPQCKICGLYQHMLKGEE
jgi:hypothetical protein